MKLKCNKDLFFSNTEKSFSKGKTYEGEYKDSGDFMTKNDQKQPHTLGFGGWLDHFTETKE